MPFTISQLISWPYVVGGGRLVAGGAVVAAQALASQTRVYLLGGIKAFHTDGFPWGYHSSCCLYWTKRKPKTVVERNALQSIAYRRNWAEMGTVTAGLILISDASARAPNRFCTPPTALCELDITPLSHVLSGGLCATAGIRYLCLATRHLCLASSQPGVSGFHVLLNYLSWLSFGSF